MISPERKNIEEILGGTRIKYTVPNYQRAYNWGMTELQELMDDLIQLKSGHSQKLFLGNLIFDVSNDSEYQIVDGQQRLTSISILFIAIREHAKRINEVDIASEIQKNISIYSSTRGTNDIKFKVSENIRDIYEFMADPKWDLSFPSELDGRGVKRQVNKVRPIFNFLYSSLESFNSNDLRRFIESLWDAYVVVIKVENTEDVFAVFERTNARGLDLNIGDLLKNYIFSYQKSGFEEKWEAIVDNANGQLPRMLKYFWVSRKGYIQQSKLYRSLKEYCRELEEIESNQDGITIFVNDLLLFSQYYSAVTDQSKEKLRDWLSEFGLNSIANNEDYFENVARVFQALKLFRVSQPIPLIFSFFVNYKVHCKSPDKLVKVLIAIEKYHFVNNVISGRVGNEVERFYSDLAPKIFDSAKPIGENTTTFLDKLRRKKANKEEFTSNFIDVINYGQKNFALVNYVFDRINNHQTKGAQYVPIFRPDVSYKKRNYNIEHILAQSKKINYSEKEQERFNEIGNLIVISRHTNSSLGDLPPSEKVLKIESDKKHWGNLRYMDEFLNDYRDDFANWDLQTIRKRSIKIANDSYQRYWNF